MATGIDRAAGYGMMLLSAVIFVYYTIWIVFLPFVEKGHPIQRLFLPRMYAVIIPVVAGVILLGIIGMFVAAVILKSKKPMPKKES
ncbi:dolichol phosphate-mannose biosynthesis regulatory protein-like [Montipora capricornis]|uniref:dolichol phosphate-mannose biosynthesis regulatory protein-like n=1 Tax=Montipora foliosa TaxID=591990 RepID=UPI0035F1835B